MATEDDARARFAALREADPVAATLVTALFQRGMIPGLRALTFVRTAKGTYGTRAPRPHAVIAHPYSPCVVPDGKRRKTKDRATI